MIAFPKAKINLGLHVINKREDGFHNLETTFLAVNLCDMLEVIEQKEKVNDKITIAYGGIPVPSNATDNLVVQAYKLLDKKFSLPPVQCFLYKKIPMGAGLGGGSSDAASTLNLLNTKFKLGINTAELRNYAAQLGSDCAFFIDNKPAYVFGRGHELEPIPLNLSGYYLVLICPPIHSSTALAYQHVLKREKLEPQNSVKIILTQPIETWKEKLKNDFEPSVFNQFPELLTIKNELYQSGALYASMSGSGSSIFGIFKSKPLLNPSLNDWITYSDYL